MYEKIIDTGDLEFTPIDFDGISIRVVYQNEKTGEMVVQTKMEPGSVIPKHFHEKANEYVFVVEGDFIEDGVSYERGAFFFGSAKVPHGPHGTKEGCILLTTFSAELDFNLVEN
jgi:quercetin dioxygenase-like cupin family protein